MRLSFVAALMALAIGCAGLSGQARATTLPDAYVHGDGAVALSAQEPGVTIYSSFHLDINRSAGGLAGVFTWSDSHGAVGPLVVIQSLVINEMAVEGNHARLQMNALLNGLPACVTLEAISGLQGSILVQARSCDDGALLYEAAGSVVQGTLEISDGTPSTYNFASGIGAIAIVRSVALGAGVGSFGFKVNDAGGAASGSLSYREFNPALPFGARRPLVQVYLVNPTSLFIEGFQATITGNGYFNGRPCWISATVVDGSRIVPANLPSAAPGALDSFSIAVRASNKDGALLYTGEGPIIRGDITLGTLPGGSIAAH